MDSKTLEGKSWWIKINSPNWPMFSTANVSRYTVLSNFFLDYYWQWRIAKKHQAFVLPPMLSHLVMQTHAYIMVP